MVDTFDWDGLKSFLAVARTGRLTAAAQKLGVDHSTLNRRINGLEKALAAKLFDRRPNGYALTSQGARLMASAEAMESAAISALREVGNETRAVAGTVRIGTPDGFGTTFLAPRLGKLADAHPDLAIQLVTQPRLFSLSQREADIAIGLARPNKGRLKARKLTDYELGLYAAEDYLARHGEPADKAQLKSHRFIGYIDEMVYAPELDYVNLVGDGLRPALATSHLMAQFSATLAGQGVCVLPCFLAGGQRTLVRLLPRQIAIQRTFWMMVHADIAEVARVRVAADFIADEARAARRLFLP